MLRLQHINSTDFNHTFDNVSMKKNYHGSPKV